MSPSPEKPFGKRPRPQKPEDDGFRDTAGDAGATEDDPDPAAEPADTDGFADSVPDDPNDVPPELTSSSSDVETRDMAHDPSALAYADALEDAKDAASPELPASVLADASDAPDPYEFQDDGDTEDTLLTDNPQRRPSSGTFDSPLAKVRGPGAKESARAPAQPAKPAPPEPRRPTRPEPAPPQPAAAPKPAAAPSKAPPAAPVRPAPPVAKPQPPAPKPPASAPPPRAVPPKPGPKPTPPADDGARKTGKLNPNSLDDLFNRAKKIKDDPKDA